MTVEELIEELQKFPKDLKVHFPDYDEYAIEPIEITEVTQQTTLITTGFTKKPFAAIREYREVIILR